MTEPALPSELFQVVRAWQHRHPLARRLQPNEVGGLGLVHLPLDAQGQALFAPKPFIAGLSHRRLMRLVAAHGFEHRPGEPDWPVRELEPLAQPPVSPPVAPLPAEPAAEPGGASAEAAPADTAVPVLPQSRWLITVALHNGRRPPLRLLIGKPHTDAKGRTRTPILGRRPLSWQRCVLAGLALVLVLTLGVLAWSWAKRPAAAHAEAAAAAPVAASAAESASAPAARAASAAASDAAEAASAAASEPNEPEAASAAVAATTGDQASASERLTNGPEAQAGDAARPRGGRGGTADKEPAPASATTRTWALVSAPSWRKAELEQARRRMPGLLGKEAAGLNVELIQTPHGRVLTLWPVTDPAQAERLANVLKRQGLETLLVDF